MNYDHPRKLWICNGYINLLSPCTPIDGLMTIPQNGHFVQLLTMTNGRYLQSYEEIVSSNPCPTLTEGIFQLLMSCVCVYMLPVWFETQCLWGPFYIAPRSRASAFSTASTSVSYQHKGCLDNHMFYDQTSKRTQDTPTLPHTIKQTISWNISHHILHKTGWEVIPWQLKKRIALSHCNLLSFGCSILKFPSGVLLERSCIKDHDRKHWTRDHPTLSLENLWFSCVSFRFLFSPIGTSVFSVTGVPHVHQDIARYGRQAI